MAKTLQDYDNLNYYELNGLSPFMKYEDVITLYNNTFRKDGKLIKPDKRFEFAFSILLDENQKLEYDQAHIASFFIEFKHSSFMYTPDEMNSYPSSLLKNLTTSLNALNCLLSNSSSKRLVFQLTSDLSSVLTALHQCIRESKPIDFKSISFTAPFLKPGSTNPSDLYMIGLYQNFEQWIADYIRFFYQTDKNTVDQAFGILNLELYLLIIELLEKTKPLPVPQLVLKPKFE